MPLSPQDTFAQFTGPIPGQSLTHEPKSMPYEKPPQHTKLEDAMNHLWDQLIDPQHLKQLLQLMEMGMPIEAIARTILFTGFSMGKWTPDLGMLMYKPLMLLLIAIAHRAKLHDVPVVMKERLHDHMMNKVKNSVMLSHKQNQAVGVMPEPKQSPPPAPPRLGGFMGNS